ncbi:MAG: hypothetical protein J5496_04980 [Lachnospiraceae bacterium]|nr:hypothetical protein [Lachnospiraceae bacterium]
MKKTKGLLLIALILALLLSACGSDAPTAEQGSKAPDSSAPASASTEKDVPVQSQPAGTEESGKKQDLAVPDSETLLAWGKTFYEDASFYFGKMQELVLDPVNNLRLNGLFTEEQKELYRLEVSLNGRAADEEGLALLEQAIDWLEDKLDADFSEAKQLLEQTEGRYREDRVESGTWALTFGTSHTSFWVNSAGFDKSPLPFGMDEAAAQLLKTQQPYRSGITREASLNLGELNYLWLELDEAGRLLSVRRDSSETDAAAAAGEMQRLAEPFLTADALEKGKAFFDSKAASVLSSGQSAWLELEGGELRLTNIGGSLQMWIEWDDAGEASFISETDRAKLTEDPFDAIGFSKAGTVPETDLGEIAGCRITLEGAVYGEPGYNGAEVGLRFTIRKDTPDAVRLSITVDHLSGWKTSFTKDLDLPAGISGDLTRTVWIPVTDLRNALPDLNGLPDFTLTATCTNGSDKQVLVQDLPVRTGYEQETTPTGTVIMDGALYMMLLDEAFPLSTVKQSGIKIFSTFRYRIYVENRSDQPLRFREYGKTLLTVNGCYIDPNYYGSAVSLPQVRLDPGDKTLGWLDIDARMLKLTTGYSNPESLEMIPLLATCSGEKNEWVPVESEDRLVIEKLPAIEIPEDCVSELEQQNIVFTEMDPITVYEDDDMLIQAEGWMTEKEKPYLTVRLLPRKAEPMSAYIQVTAVNGSALTASRYAGVILNSYEGAAAYSYVTGLNDELALKPEDYVSMTLSLRKGVQDESGAGGFSYYGQDPVEIELDLKP